MGEGAKELAGPDLRAGVPLSELPEGEPFAGHADGEGVVLVRRGDEVFALGGTCTHYGGPLAEGLVEGETLRCPWHHACFSLRTGEAVAAPALNPVPRWGTRVADGRVTVTVKEERPTLASVPDAVPSVPAAGRVAAPSSVVIVGAGAAGSAAAEMLRREGYAGPIALVDPDPDAPYDRPNLSKDYLAGNAPEEWIPLRPPGFHEAHGIERMVASVSAIDAAAQSVTLSDGRSLPYGAVLLATGATPIRPPIPGADFRHVHVLRSLADCRELIAAVGAGRRVVIAGASFIGMEAAASLRARGLEVAVVAPETVPFARSLGTTLGGFLRGLHERQGVRFHLGRTIATIHEDRVVLDDGTVVDADVVLLGVGVRPDVAVARAAGLDAANGIEVDPFLATRIPNVYAAGDIASFPDARTGERIRIEHWVVAQRQGQAAARSMLGRRERFDAVPFFWTRQYDVGVSYVGHAAGWDREVVDGSPEARDCRVTYLSGGAVVAVATIGRDRESLAAELALERGDAVLTSAAFG
jgi:NADPH-dependent 2,4-dienoyl-CoA reductase/sulfur reductase-like enzyme/nitrite reductase/ring-hydroxylating ferredoxin subunit